MIKMGYLPHISWTVSLIFGLLCLFLPGTLTVLTLGLPKFNDTSWYAFYTVYIRLSPAILGILILCIISEISCALLPSTQRNFSKREMRSSWSLLKKVCSILLIFLFIILMLLLVSVLCFNADSWRSTVKLIIRVAVGLTFLLQIFGDYIIAISKDKSSKDVDEFDGIPFGLYIRSFEKDTDPFFFGKIHKKSNLLATNLSDFKHKNSMQHITFQKFFTKSINEKIGRLVGLGNPLHKIPPEGLNASYLSDENWQNEFALWANKATFIVTTPAHTSGLKFELGYAFERGFATKVFIFTPTNQIKFLPTFQRWIINLGRAVKKVNYDRFYQDLKAIGYQLPKKRLLEGMVIGFDKKGNYKILAVGAKLPDDYTNAVIQHLNSQKE
jgi:hypothetical protein